ncbi:hypothetical protein E2C01_093890 [Portunus trituberculatus]|uniref:Secreted protein n=1 Tax=Portunus trituberculatus TaxID=210409 RepID=A0A5B7JZC5_PORTR|nr:hypothetical protein [Portunus trituberculatus]
MHILPSCNFCCSVFGRIPRARRLLSSSLCLVCLMGVSETVAAASTKETCLAISRLRRRSKTATPRTNTNK